tara:strand:+ start:5750 stop:5944 length:195 start_codon:yes stop_codon:yes gene_type:complete
MLTLDELKEIVELLQSAEKDAEKFDRGVGAAGVRLRKKCLEASKLLKGLRGLVLEVRESRKAKR